MEKRTLAPPDIRRLVDFLDAKYRGPAGFRFGWDGILGLIPGVGDLITASMSVYVIVRSATLGAPPSLLMRMGGNVLFENLIDMIPLFGNIFYFFWKANSRNLVLLENFLQEPRSTQTRARIWVALTISAILVLVGGMIALSFLILKFLWEY